MIFHSPWVSLEPYPVIPFSQTLEETAARVPDKVAFVNPEGKSYTYAQLWAASGRLATFLQARGIKKGDFVGIYLANCVEYPLIIHGILRAGASVTTLNPLYTEREVTYQLKDAGAVAVFASQQNRPNVEASQKDLPDLRDIFNVENVDSMIEGLSDKPAPVQIDPMNDIAMLPYSSGTTGLAKGVMLTHYNLTTNVRQMQATNLINAYSNVLDFLPFYHIYGLIVIMGQGIGAGATQVVMSRFVPEQALQLVVQHRLTDLFFAPPAIHALLTVPTLNTYDMSSVRYIMSGAAPLPLELIERTKSILNVTVFQGYGMTEASPCINIDMQGRIKDGTVGPPTPDTLEKVVDPVTGKELGPNETGELWAYGGQIMKGYWNAPEATQLALTPDGWLRTGDIVSMDEEGYVTVVDRLKEMIKYKGYQVAPAELEALLIEHPAVLDVAVIPKPDAESGEIPKAFVVLRNGMDASPEELMSFIEKKVAPYKKLRELEFIGQVPKSASGKILRRELVAQERAKQG